MVKRTNRAIASHGDSAYMRSPNETQSPLAKCLLAVLVAEAEDEGAGKLRTS